MKEFKLQKLFNWELAHKKISEKPYKVYTALLTQTGTNAPVATVLENTIGDIVWTRNSNGRYYGTLNNTFLQNKTFILTTSFGQPYIVTNRLNDDVIVINILNTSYSNVDWEISSTSPASIEIRVYN